MSSGDAAPSTSTSPCPHPESYFCHQCNLSVTVTPSPNSDLLCPLCHDGFLEEIITPAIPLPPPVPIPIPVNFNLSDFFELPAFNNPIDLLPLFSTSLRASAAPNFHFRAGGLNFGDYDLGPGFEQIMQQLLENDSNRYGTPPASKAAVEGLPSVPVDEALMKSDSAQCAVCMDEFVVGGENEAKMMPCKHVFHKGCILPWLELHNSCPVCRFELPTDDPDYENGARGSGGSGAGSSRAGGGDLGAGTLQRRFTISFPPETLRASGEGSNAAAAGGGDGGSSRSGEDNPGLGSETRYEDLD